MHNQTDRPNFYDFLNNIVALIFIIFFIYTWLLGIVIAKGFFSTIISILFPPYSWYLVVEHYFFILPNFNCS